MRTRWGTKFHVLCHLHSWQCKTNQIASWQKWFPQVQKFEIHILFKNVRREACAQPGYPWAAGKKRAKSWRDNFSSLKEQSLGHLDAIHPHTMLSLLTQALGTEHMLTELMWARVIDRWGRGPGWRGVRWGAVPFALGSSPGYMLNPCSKVADLFLPCFYF